MKVEVRYFASVREALGPPAEQVDIDAAASVASLRDALASRGGRYAESLGRQRRAAQRAQPAFFLRRGRVV